MLRDDIFEEDMFEDNPNPTANKDIDEDTQYVLDLMDKALRLCEQAVDNINNLKEINNIFEEKMTGISNKVLNEMEFVFTKMLPNLVLDEDTDHLVQSTKKVLNTSDEVAKEFIEQKRTTLLENIEKNNKK